MSNMSYCRFQNTLPDLKDCADALDDIDGDLESLSKKERSAAIELVAVCAKISFWFGKEQE